MDKNLEIDKIDQQILEILLEDGEVSYAEISKRINVSSGTVHFRMNKLKESGVVLGTELKIDVQKMGWDVSAFIGVYLDKSSLYDTVIGQLEEIEEVVSMNYTTGNYSIFVKILCKDTKHLREVLHKLQGVEGIQRTETFISLEEKVIRKIPKF